MPQPSSPQDASPQDAHTPAAPAVNRGSAAAPAPVPEPEKTCRRSRVRQLVPLVALLILLIGEIAELRARGAASAAFARIERAFGDEGHRQVLLRDEVHQVMGRQADQYDDVQGTEIYRWRGSLKTHTVYIRYLWHDGQLYASDFSLDDDLRVGRGRPKGAPPVAQ